MIVPVARLGVRHREEADTGEFILAILCKIFAQGLTIVVYSAGHTKAVPPVSFRAAYNQLALFRRFRARASKFAAN
jgi:hypothetical protein